jgi:hypothetical protein
MRIAAFLVLTVSLATPAAAHYSSVAELFKQFDLIGRFATDCGAPARPDNPHVSIAVSGGDLVQEEQNIGASFAVNHYRVLSAKRISATRLSVQVMFQAGGEAEQRQILEFLVRNGTRRTMFNRREGGAVRVKNGIALATGTKTPPLNKCE